MLHPVEATTVPVAEREHHLRDVARHGREVAGAVTLRVHHDFVGALCQGHAVVCELVIVVHDEFDLHVERTLSVDRVLGTGSVLSWRIVEDVSGAVATSVAVSVDSILGCIALVSGRVERVSIGLLNIELGAPVTANLVGVAVLEGIAVVVERRHEDGVEGRDAATADQAQVDIVLHGAAQKIWFVVRRSVQSWRCGQVHSVVVAVGHRLTLSRCIGPVGVLHVQRDRVIVLVSVDSRVLLASHRAQKSS